MSEVSSESAAAASPTADLDPAPKLTRGMLTVLLTLVCALPIGIVSFLWFLMPANPYPPLDVEVELAQASGSIDPSTGRPSPFPQYVVRNVSDETLYRVVVYAYDSLDNRFEFNFPEPLAPGEERRLNARDFSLRTAHTLEEGATIESMEVSARLRYGARGLSEWIVEDERPRKVESERSVESRP